MCEEVALNTLSEVAFFARQVPVSTDRIFGADSEAYSSVVIRLADGCCRADNTETDSKKMR